MRTYNKHNNNSNKQKRSTKGKSNRPDDLEQITAELDLICRRRLSDGAIRKGVLAGMEPAIRQLSAVTQSAPPDGHLLGFKVHHLRM